MRRAAELGMNHSSFFGLAAITALIHLPAAWAEFAEPRSKARKTGVLRAKAGKA
jgi:hypothetical protein